jgi:hypothetical protein
VVYNAPRRTTYDPVHDIVDEAEKQKRKADEGSGRGREKRSKE